MTSTLPEALPAEARNVYPPGAVLVPCHDHARYHHFTHDLTLLDVPDGSTISFNRSASIVQNFNMGIASMLEPNAAGPDPEWCWIIGDDHTFARDVVMRLLHHLYPEDPVQPVDIVVPLCVRRGPPFTLVQFDYEGDKDELGRQMYHTLQFADLPEHGLVEVIASGSAGMLVRREVFETIGAPWFANSDGLTTDEDMEFCRRARAAGYKVWLDTGTAIGHLGILTAMPARVDGVWGLVIDFQGQGENKIFLPGGIEVHDPGTPDRMVGQYGAPAANFTLHEAKPE